MTGPAAIGRDTVTVTPRLRLRRLRPADLDEVARMVADPEQMRFYPRPKSRGDVREWIAWNLGLYEQHGFGTWCVESVHESVFLGYCGLRPLELDSRHEVELAWHVDKAHWNQGIATEAAQAALGMGFDRFGLARLVAIIHPGNCSSRRVAQKLGMGQERTLVHDGQPTVVYVITPA